MKETQLARVSKLMSTNLLFFHFPFCLKNIYFFVFDASPKTHHGMGLEAGPKMHSIPNRVSLLSRKLLTRRLKVMIETNLYLGH